MHPPSELVDRLRTDLAFHRKAFAAQTDPRERRKAYKAFIRACDALSEAVALPLSPFKLDPTRTLDQIGLMLSVTGLDLLLDTGDIWQVNARALGDRRRYAVEANGNLGVRAIDELTLHRRASVAIEAGPQLLQKLITEIKRPVERLLAMEPTNKGGRPPDVERRHVIREAQKVFEATTGQPATKADGGPFVPFCHSICLELDLDVAQADNIGALVAEVLHPRVRKRTKKAK